MGSLDDYIEFVTNIEKFLWKKRARLRVYWRQIGRWEKGVLDFFYFIFINWVNGKFI